MTSWLSGIAQAVPPLIRRTAHVRAARCCLLSGFLLGLGAPSDLNGQELTVTTRRDVFLGQAVREPAVVELSDGTLFVAGYSRDPSEAGDPPNLYRSDDRGVGWVQVDVGSVEQGALGNSDVDLEVGPDGSLYFLTMGFDRTVGEGTHVSLGISRDAGASWTWRLISRNRFDDRPWIVVSPSGRAHVIWNDGRGVRHAVSADAGDTWIEVDRISEAGGSSHLALGPRGQLAVRVAPGSASGINVDPEADFVAVSHDEGRSWTHHPAPGNRDWEEVPRWVEPIAWDSSGALHYLWSEGTVLRIGTSLDGGATWESEDLHRGSEPLFYPYILPGPGSLLAVSWFSGHDNDLRAHVGLVDTRSSAPTLRVSPPLEVDAWRIRRGERVRDSAGEYFPVMFLEDGSLVAVLPIQDSERGNGFSWITFAR